MLTLSNNSRCGSGFQLLCTRLSPLFYSGLQSSWKEEKQQGPAAKSAWKDIELSAKTAPKEVQ